MNPFGERAPSEPLPGGCGDVLCAQRVWFKVESPHDEAVALPCDTCAVVAADVILDAVALRPTPEAKRRARRSQSPEAAREDLRRSLRSADCHTAGPL